MRAFSTAILASAVLTLTGCPDIEGAEGAPGAQGPQGEPGPAGAPGPQGEPGKSAESATVSGSRLKRQIRTGEDGSRAFESLYDPDMGTPCAWMVAADGDDRCLPSDARSVPIALRYLDAECNEGPIAMIRKVDCGTLPPLLTYQDPGECCFRVRALAPAISTPEGQLYEKRLSDAGPACYPAVKVAGSLYYGLHDETAPDAFVAGTVVIQ